MKEWKDMKFTEKAVDTVSGLWKLLGAIVGLCVIVCLPIVVIVLLVRWLG